MNKNLVLVGIGILALVGALAWLKPATVIEKVVEQLGAIPGTDFPALFSFGGVETYTERVPMVASTTPCLFTPFNRASTSTLEYFSAHFTANALGAFTADLSTTTVQAGNGSSTPAYLYNVSVPAVPVAPVIWDGLISTTSPGVTFQVLAKNGGTTATGLSVNYIRPNERLGFRIATGTPNNTSTSFPTGWCEATFKKLHR